MAKLGSEMKDDNQASPSSSTSAEHGFDATLWRKFWKAPSLPRVKEVAWRVCVGAVPTRLCLRRRGMDLDPSCPVCGHEEESIDHLFIHCPVARGCWFVSLGVRTDAGTSTFMDFMAAVLRNKDGWCIAEVQRMIYCLWEGRNKVLFELREPGCATVLSRFAAMESPSQLGTNGNQVDWSVVKWSRPAAGMIKINVDASLGGDLLAGFGMVARDEDGEILAAASHYPTVATSATMAEAFCLRWAMELSSQLGFRRVQFETDCLQLFHAWKKGVGRSPLFSLLQDCKTFVQLFDCVEFTFTRRQGNTCADFMARNASTLSNIVWVEEAPRVYVAFYRQIFWLLCRL
ncbi:uncharacterized protein LOC130743986 [Lotus japonicus]|uniref:uncharacterized protein LOC130743986 n=1 Tax=Lotus japonicus TaxID=34305 RepID=UPI00258813BA|nr:uncharacterized protein LOC130743986 [Lotus japonicus]